MPGWPTSCRVPARWGSSARRSIQRLMRFWMWAGRSRRERRAASAKITWCGILEAQFLFDLFPGGAFAAFFAEGFEFLFGEFSEGVVFVDELAVLGVFAGHAFEVALGDDDEGFASDFEGLR